VGVWMPFVLGGGKVMVVGFWTAVSFVSFDFGVGMPFTLDLDVSSVSSVLEVVVAFCFASLKGVLSVISAPSSSCPVVAAACNFLAFLTRFRI